MHSYLQHTRHARWPWNMVNIGVSRLLKLGCAECNAALKGIKGDPLIRCTLPGYTFLYTYWFFFFFHMQKQFSYTIITSTGLLQKQSSFDEL